MKRLLKILSMVCAVLMLALCIVGCNKEQAPDADATPTDVVAVTDAPADPTAELAPTREPQRIVCLAPNMVEIVYALGLGDEIVGWSAYTDYPPEVEEREGWVPYGDYYYTDTADFNVDAELAKDVAVVSKFYDCNYDVIAAVEPTILFGFGSAQTEMVEQLKTMGYAAYNYEPATLDDVYAMMVDMGNLLGVGDYAQQLVDGYYAEIEEIKAVTANLQSVPVYFEIAHRVDYGEYGAYGPYTNASGSPFDDMMTIAGGTNIFEDMQGDYVEVTYEQVVEKNPVVIMSPYWPNALDEEVTTLYEIMTRPGFETTAAVKAGRVYYYDSSLMKRFGPRTITAIKKLAYLLHPYYFENPENSVSPWELGKIDVFESFPAPLH